MGPGRQDDCGVDDAYAYLVEKLSGIRNGDQDGQPDPLDPGLAKPAGLTRPSQENTYRHLTPRSPGVTLAI